MNVRHIMQLWVIAIISGDIFCQFLDWLGGDYHPISRLPRDAHVNDMGKAVASPPKAQTMEVTSDMKFIDTLGVISS